MEVEYSLIEESLCKGFIEKSMKVALQDESRVYLARSRTEISLPISYRDGAQVKLYLSYKDDSKGNVGKVSVSDCGRTALHQRLSGEDLAQIYQLNSYDLIYPCQPTCEREIFTYDTYPTVDEVSRAIREIISFICNSYLFIGRYKKE